MSRVIFCLFLNKISQQKPLKCYGGGGGGPKWAKKVSRII